jgi:hypothetical protein
MNVTIPPSTAIAFKNHVTKICDLVELDRGDKSKLPKKLLKYVEKDWYNAIEEGFTTEDAQQRAIERLGDVESVARSLSEKDLIRFFLDEDGRPVRLLVILFFCWGEAFANYRLAHKSIDVTAALMIPENLGKLVVTMAGFYFIVRLPFFWRLATGFFDTYVLAHPSNLSDRRHDDPKPNPALPAIRNCLRAVGLVLAFALWFYATRRTLVLFVEPFINLNTFWNANFWTKPGFHFSAWYYVFTLLLLAFMGIMAMLAALVEIFDWPKAKREGHAALTWIFYIMPSRVSAHFFARNSKSGG